MGVKKGQRIEVEIETLAFGGKGLAKPDGFAVFVDKAVPGDKAIIRIVKKKKNYAEARIDKLLFKSPFRTDAHCPYSGHCGGCKWQFLDYNRQLYYKKQHVIESLMHIGLVKNVVVHDTFPSSQTFEYRNKMEFSCADRRWLLPEEMGKEDLNRSFALGLHVPGTFHKVIDIKACLLHPDFGNQILDDVRSHILKSTLPVYGLKSHVGFWRFIMLRNSAAYDQWMVNIITAFEDRTEVQKIADDLMEKYPRIVSVINNITSKKAGVAIGEYELLLAGKDHLIDKIDSYEFMISANSFFQTNTRGAADLYQIAKKYAELRGNEFILDLYSGIGTIAIFLSDFAEEIIGVEQVESAVKDAERNRTINQISNCRFICADIRECLPSIEARVDVMIIDPPRIGMHKDVVKQILTMAPQKIVYISCNPASLARDVSMMQERYHLLEVQPVDMFPHTYHIEVVAKLEIRKS